MTSPSDVYVWVWLPGATNPVVAGRLRLYGKSYQFAYGESYLSRPEAISLFTPELPLRSGWIDPREGMTMAGCLWDSSPDSWGQRVIIARLTGISGTAADEVTLEQTTFLLHSGSNRIGGLDFQVSATDYVPRSTTATLDELHAAADAVQSGEIHEELFEALVNGTAVGGARPKVLLRDSGVEYIAKFSVSSDPYPIVKAEAVGMELARRVGIDVPRSRVVKSLGRDVLLIERFDRPSPGQRRMMVSGLTLLGFGDFLGARYSSYPEILNVLLRWAQSGRDLRRTLFERIVFNIAIGNTDDHARNHAAFWDGQHLELTPAYDLCPQLRTGGEANQAMDISQSGARSSRFETCVKAAAEYGLTVSQARNIIDHQVTTIRENWQEVTDMFELDAVDKNLLQRGPILNRYAFTD
jgi:serine/threonine-protein kinase HipA